MTGRFCLALLLSFTPAATMAYTVTLGAGPVGDTPSRFGEAALAASSFAKLPQASSFTQVKQGSAFNLAKMESDLREKTIATLAELGAREENGRIIITLSGDVLFDFDKADIRADARPVLAQISEVLLALDDAPVEIIGHTDAKGSDDYN